MIPIRDPETYTVPPSEGFTPDRLGVRRVVIDVDRVTGAFRANLTPCPATAEAWGPLDCPDFSTADVVRDIAALPADAQPAAFEALQSISRGLMVLYTSLRKE